MIEETHKRVWSFHAWINPYRGVQPQRLQLLQIIISPEFILNGFKSTGEKKYFIRHLVSHYLTNIVIDIATQYDIDGISY